MRKHIASIAAQEDDNEINLTPMLDVVFIMLIFFIVTATFIRESGIDANRPDQNTATTVQEKGAILIVIDSTNSIFIDNRAVDPSSVRANVERMHAEDSERPLVIQAHPNSSTDTLVTVMDASRAAGVYDIALAEL